MALFTYNPDEVTIVFAGVPIFGKGEARFLSVEQNEDTFGLFIGVDGEASRGRSTNRSGRVTITLLQSSVINDALSALAALDQATPGGDGIGPLLIKDFSGRTLVFAELAWVVRPPTVEFARTAGEREWVIEAAKLAIFAGGNTPAGVTGPLGAII